MISLRCADTRIRTGIRVTNDYGSKIGTVKTRHRSKVIDKNIFWEKNFAECICPEKYRIQIYEKGPIWFWSPGIGPGNVSVTKPHKSGILQVYTS